MAYPDIVSYTSGFTTSNATSTSITVPSGTQADDLMLLLISKDGTGTFTTPTNWTQLANAGSTAQAVGIFYRQLTGSLSNFSISHASEMTAWLCLRIPNGDVPQISSAATGSSTTPNPPNFHSSHSAGAEVFGAAIVAEPKDTRKIVGFNAYKFNRSMFNTLGVKADIRIYTTGIASSEAFGDTEVRSRYSVLGRGIASAEEFGSPTLLSRYRVTPTGIESGTAFGAPVVRLAGTAHYADASMLVAINFTVSMDAPIRVGLHADRFIDAPIIIAAHRWGGAPADAVEWGKPTAPAGAWAGKSKPAGAWEKLDKPPSGWDKKAVPDSSWVKKRG